MCLTRGQLFFSRYHGISSICYSLQPDRYVPDFEIIRSCLQRVKPDLGC